MAEPNLLTRPNPLRRLYGGGLVVIFRRHTDGSVRFWDASAGSLQVLYKLKTAKVFEKAARSKSPETGGDDDQFSVQLLSFCPESRKLAVAGISSYVVLFKFRKLESTFETTVITHVYYYRSWEGKLTEVGVAI